MKPLNVYVQGQEKGKVILRYHDKKYHVNANVTIRGQINLKLQIKTLLHYRLYWKGFLVVTNMYMYTASRLFCKCMDIDPYYIKLHIFLFFLCIKEHLDFLQDDCCSSVKNLQGGITLFYRTFGACHLGLCTTESATTCL